MSDAATKELRLRYNSEIGNTGTVAQDVVRYLKAIQENTAATNKALLEMGGAAGRGTEGLRGMGAEGSRAIQTLARELGTLVAGLVSVGSAIAVVKQGFDFNSEIQQMQLGLSAIVAANEKVTNAQGQQVTGAQKLAYAQGQVADVFAKLKQDAINTTATMPQLVGAFQQVLGPAMGVGMSLDDARKVTVQLVQTMGALGIPMEQARSEINAIITGQMTQDTNLKNILKLSNEEVKLWAQKGTLAQELLKRTADFGEAGKQAGEIWNGAISNLGDNLQQKVLGPLTGEAFKTATNAVKRLNAEAFNDETLNRAVRWGRILNDGVTAALIGSEAVGRILLMGADGFLGALERGKRWAAEVGTNQAKKEMRGQALDRLGLNPMQRWELGWNTNATDPSSLMLSRAEALGVSPEKRAQLAKDLARIDKASSMELQRFDRGQTQGVQDQMAAERARAESAMAGKTHQFNTGGAGAGGGTSDKLTGYDLAVERFDHGRMGVAEFIKTARAEQKKFNEDTKEYWAIQDKIDAALKKQADSAKRLADEQKAAAEAALELAIAVTPELQRFSVSGGAGGLKAAPGSRGGLGVSGGTFMGGFSLGRGTRLDAPTFTGLHAPTSEKPTEIGKVSGDSLVESFQKLSDRASSLDEAQRRAVDAMQASEKALRDFVSSVEDASKAAGKAVDLVGSGLDLLGSYQSGRAGDGARALNGLASYADKSTPTASAGAGAFTIAMDLIARRQQATTEANDYLEAASRGQLVNRSELYGKYLQSDYANGKKNAMANATRRYNILDPGQAFQFLMNGGSAGFGDDDASIKAQKDAAGDMLRDYDRKTASRLEHSRQGGALGTYNRQMDGIEDWAAAMKDKLSPDVLDHHRKALEADAEAAYKAAKGMEELDKVANAFGAFSKTSALREQLGLGKQTPADIANALSMSGSGVSIGAISGADNQKKVLDALQGLLYTQSLGQGGFDANQTAMRTSATASAGSAYGILESLGISTEGKNTDQLIAMIQSVIVPAMQGLADAGLGATKNIGMLNSDNPGELKFDAPQMGVTTIQQSNTWNIDGNVIGNPSAFEQLARLMGISIAVQGEQIA